MDEYLCVGRFFSNFALSKNLMFPLNDIMTTTMNTLYTRISAVALTLALNATAAIAQAPADTMAVDTCVADLPQPAVTTSTGSKIKPNLYDMPYSRTASCPDWGRMWLHTGVLFAGGIATLGVLQALPEDATAWNKERITSIPFWKRWSYHVRRGPVWDGDNFVFNYILHPYAGAAYYMGARSIGFNMLGSFIYCAAISTVFWEYGIEAFMEIPSIQDLIITPLSGILLGECFYRLKRSIVSNGYRLWGSRLLGNVVAFIIDPVNEVIGLFAGNPCREGLKKKDLPDVSLTPWVSPACGGSAGFTIIING